MAFSAFSAITDFLDVLPVQKNGALHAKRVKESDFADHGLDTSPALGLQDPCTKKCAPKPFEEDQRSVPANVAYG
jgi:hypothetical protein